jgi:uncharacterized protein YciI
VISLACLILGIAAASATFQEPHPAPTFFAFLVTGKNPPKATQEEIQTYQKAHIDNFKRLFAERKLSTAGPLSDPTKFKRGILVLTVKTKGEIAPLFVPDPYVSKGFMELQAFPITVEFGGVNTTNIDPNGIEENRIVVFSVVKGALPDPELATRQREYARSGSRSAGLAFYATAGDSPEIKAVALFKGKDDAAIQAWIDASPFVKSGTWTAVKMTQWIGKGVLSVPGSN